MMPFQRRGERGYGVDGARFVHVSDERLERATRLRHLHESRGRLIAHAETGRPHPGHRVGIELHMLAARPMRVCRTETLLERRADSIGTAGFACDVVADMEDATRSWRRRQQGVESRDAPRICGRNVEPRADVVHRAFADPADARLHCLQCGEQQVSPRADSRTGMTDMPLSWIDALAALPLRLCRSEQSVHGFALGARRRRVDQLDIHLLNRLRPMWQARGARSRARASSASPAANLPRMP